MTIGKANANSHSTMLFHHSGQSGMVSCKYLDQGYWPPREGKPLRPQRFREFSIGDWGCHQGL